MRVHRSFFALCLILSGCSSSYEQKKITPVDGVCRSCDPHQIKGVWYHPQRHYEYKETGIASWYGPGFHMRKNAAGFAFDQHRISAAHKTLPLPTVVKVTNLDNGRSLVLVVDDRGPYVDGRIIDLSYGSAKHLGVYANGTAREHVESLVHESKALSRHLGKNFGRWGIDPSGRTWHDIYHEDIKPNFSGEMHAQEILVTDVSHNPSFFSKKEVTLDYILDDVSKTQSHSQVKTTHIIHMGTYVHKKNAQKIVDALQNAKIQASIKKVTLSPGQPFYQVTLPPFQSAKAAGKTQQKLHQLGYKDAHVITA